MEGKRAPAVATRQCGYVIRCSKADCINCRIRPGNGDIRARVRGTLGGVSGKRVVPVRTSKEASSNIRTLKRIVRFSCPTTVGPSRLLQTLGDLLPSSVLVGSIRRTTRSFRSHCRTLKGGCVCQISLSHFPGPFGQLCAARRPCHFGVRGLRRTVGGLRNRRSFADFYSAGASGASLIHAICRTDIEGSRIGGRLIFAFENGNFLCGVVEVFIKALLRVTSNLGGIRRVSHLLRIGSHHGTKPATPSRKLCLIRICCSRRGLEGN